MSRVLRSRWLSNRKNRRPRGLSGGCLWAGHRLNTTPRLNAKSQICRAEPWPAPSSTEPTIVSVSHIQRGFGIPAEMRVVRAVAAHGVASGHGSEGDRWPYGPTSRTMVDNTRSGDSCGLLPIGAERVGDLRQQAQLIVRAGLSYMHSIRFQAGRPRKSR